MKKFACLLSIAIGAVQLSAQTVNMTERTSDIFNVVPKEVTTNAKSYFAVMDESSTEQTSELTVSLGPETHIVQLSIPNVKVSGKFYKYAIGGVKESVMLAESYMTEIFGSCSSDKDAIKQILIERNCILPNAELTEFTTIDDKTAYYYEMNANFYDVEKYGYKYPQSFYVVDSLLRFVHYEYTIDYDFTNAVWRENMDYKESLLRPFAWQNADASFYPTSKIIISQNIFNKDDKWEYILADIECVEEDGDINYFDTGDSIEFYKECINRHIVKGYKIMNDEGSQLLYITIPNDNDETTDYAEVEYVACIGGLLYMVTKEDYYEGKDDNIISNTGTSIYVIDPSTTSVQSVSRYAQRMVLSNNVVSKGQTINVSVNDAQNDDNLSMTDMSGRTLKSTSASQSEVLIPTSSMPKGQYIISLNGGQSSSESQKIIIK